MIVRIEDIRLRQSFRLRRGYDGQVGGQGRQKSEARRRKAVGFTLIELMVVISVILVLAGIIVGGAKYAQTKAARSRAQAEIATMETALEHYKSDNGVYPLSTAMRLNAQANSGSLYAALAGGPGNPKTYFTFKADQIRAISATETNIIDPFGSAYNYYCTQPVNADQTNNTSFDLWSYGPDGQNDTADDIVNWRQ
jgi:general secretion pathway protein G